jgi:hypothetical protein
MGKLPWWKLQINVEQLGRHNNICTWHSCSLAMPYWRWNFNIFLLLNVYNFNALIHCGLDLPEWLERMTADVTVATVLDSISESSDTVDSEGQLMKQCWIKEQTNVQLFISKPRKFFSGSWRDEGEGKAAWASFTVLILSVLAIHVI